MKNITLLAAILFFGVSVHAQNSKACTSCRDLEEIASQSVTLKKTETERAEKLIARVTSSYVFQSVYSDRGRLEPDLAKDMLTVAIHLTPFENKKDQEALYVVEALELLYSKKALKPIFDEQLKKHFSRDEQKLFSDSIKKVQESNSAPGGNG